MFIFPPEVFLQINRGHYFDQDLPLQRLRGGQLLGFVHVDVGQVQLVLQYLSQTLGHPFLLRHRAVVFYGQDHRVPGRRTMILLLEEQDSVQSWYRVTVGAVNLTVTL